MPNSTKIRRKLAEPKPVESLVTQYRAIGQASLQAALMYAGKKSKKALETRPA